MAALPRRTRLLVLLLTFGLGALLFLWRLGATGLVDETPPLFAASARGMVERGDWLIPHVNGLPRYDKPPLVYWLMGLFYALPGQARWDPLGSWAAALPSALATIAVMLALADTLLRWPQSDLCRDDPKTAAALTTGAAGLEQGRLEHRDVEGRGAGHGSPEAAGVDPPDAPHPIAGGTARNTADAEPWPGGLAPAAAIDALRPDTLAPFEADAVGTTPDAPAAVGGRAGLPQVLTALTAALAFGLSPLVLLWGRIPVSDALFTALLALTALSSWRRYADPGQSRCQPWLLLGLAVLTKGPVAVVLLLLTWLLFWGLQGDGPRLLRRLRPIRGLLLTTVVALPWYGLALLRDGRAFWDSFIGYHNLQRFSAVVNDHLQPWWYFGPVLVVASLPFTPLLLLGLLRAIGRRPWRRCRWSGPARPGSEQRSAPAASLARFAACWLLAVLLFFTAAATKLPSYWLPATPAAALLIALAGRAPGLRRSRCCPDGVAATLQDDPTAARMIGAAEDRAGRLAWQLTLLLTTVLALAFALAPLWVPQIRDPEMPTLPAELLSSGYPGRAALLWSLAATAGWLLLLRPPAGADGTGAGRTGTWRLLILQLPLVLYVPAALLPSWALGDRLRGLPVRRMAAAVQRFARPAEPVAMVGVLKPSLHFYSHRVVIYEGVEPAGLLNLADRLLREDRPGMHPGPATERPTALVVIDQGTASSPIWSGLGADELARTGLYRLWRLDRRALERRAAALRADGHRPTWTLPRPERY